MPRRIRTLIKAGADANARPRGIDPPLHLAALHNNAAAIRVLAAAKADVNATVGTGNTAALHLAAGAGGADAVHALIETGGEVDLKGPFGSTPLHDAATHNNAAAIRVLAAAKANVNAKEDKLYATPLHVAAQWCHVEAIRALIEAKADVDARSKIDATPLSLAIGAGCFEGVAILQGEITKDSDQN